MKRVLTRYFHVAAFAPNTLPQPRRPCMTREQVQRLYARNLEVFPPPGLSYDDSYFARVDKERPGRLYIGYLTPFIGQQRCLVPLTAALLAGPCVVFDGAVDQENFLEACVDPGHLPRQPEICQGQP